MWNAELAGVRKNQRENDRLVQVYRDGLTDDPLSEWKGFEELAHCAREDQRMSFDAAGINRCVKENIKQRATPSQESLFVLCHPGGRT
ncbi:MAG TPA: hypothetical protein VK897_02500 [Anaerolineales bacterium]|nr:hypothetical protein [Anaerolineales bacterium]